MRNRREAFFNGKACVDCGSVSVLQLDHVDPSIKVAHKVWSWTQARRDVELAKCVVRCRPCHQAKTFSQMFEPRRHGTTRMYVHGGCRCQPCKDAVAAKARREKAARLARFV